MSVAKTIEITAESPTSFDDAVRQGIEKVKTTLDNVQGAWVKDQMVVLEDGAVSCYRVRMNVTFELR